MISTQPLGPILKTTKGKKPTVMEDSPALGLTPYIDISAVEHGTQRSWADPATSKTVPAESLVMVWDGARSGWTGFTKFAGALGSTLAALETPLDKHFLGAFLRLHFSDINTNHRGSGIPHVNPEYLNALEIPVLTPGQQREIAELCDVATLKANSARTHLAFAAHAIERFQRALLTSAAGGRLTADWRTNRGIVDGDLPGGWNETTVNGVAECLDRTRRPINAAERARRPGNIPYYGANGQVGWIDLPLFDETLVLVVEDETFTGRTKPFSYQITGPSWVNNHAHVLRTHQGISPQILNIALAYYDFVPLTSGTTGRRKLNQAALMSAPLVLPPPDEQAEIVRRVDKIRELVASLKLRVETAQNRVDRTAQAVLSKAFRGELFATS